MDLRFFGALVSVGVFRGKEGLSVLASQLQLLVFNDRDEHNHLSILTSFCRHCGDDYMGLLPRKIRSALARLVLSLLVITHKRLYPLDKRM